MNWEEEWNKIDSRVNEIIKEPVPKCIAHILTLCGYTEITSLKGIPAESHAESPTQGPNSMVNSQKDFFDSIENHINSYCLDSIINFVC